MRAKSKANKLAACNIFRGPSCVFQLRKCVQCTFILRWMENTHPNPTCRLVLMPHVFDSPVLRAVRISTLMVSDSCMPLGLVSVQFVVKCFAALHMQRASSMLQERMLATVTTGCRVGGSGEIFLERISLACTPARARAPCLRRSAKGARVAGFPDALIGWRIATPDPHF